MEVAVSVVLVWVVGAMGALVVPKVVVLEVDVMLVVHVHVVFAVDGADVPGAASAGAADDGGAEGAGVGGCVAEVGCAVGWAVGAADGAEVGAAVGRRHICEKGRSIGRPSSMATRDGSQVTVLAVSVVVVNVAVSIHV